jgi:hypothetical protein
VLNGPVKVRDAPNGNELKNLKLKNGTLVEIEPDSMQDIGGYIWWKHAAGWSAERTSDGKKVFMGDPSLPSVDDPPSLDTLPMRNALFVRWPVDLEKVNWVQYFGNTKYAFEHGKEWGYQKFAQGMHSGLDLGSNRPEGIPVYAGLYGEFVAQDDYGVHVSAGEYYVIYQHLIMVPNFAKGALITPDTPLGEMERLPGNAHLHLETRYAKQKFIVNPLLLLPEPMCDACLKKFSNFEKYFYKDARWNQWQTPLDQPMILRGGAVIGPLG